VECEVIEEDVTSNNDEYEWEEESVCKAEEGGEWYDEEEESYWFLEPCSEVSVVFFSLVVRDDLVEVYDD